MNPEQPSREQIEVRITALLLGELPPDEAQLLRYTMAQDPGLQALHDELELAMGLVREAAKHPAEEAVAKSAPLRLSAERRRILLAHFRTPPGKAEPLFWLRPIRQSLVPSLVAVAVIAVLAALLLPTLASAKRHARRIAAQTDKMELAMQELSTHSLTREAAPSAAVVRVPPEPPLAPPPAPMVRPVAAPIALPAAQAESGQLAENVSAGAPVRVTSASESEAVGGLAPAPSPPAESVAQPPVVMEPGAAEPVALAMNDQSSNKKEGRVYSAEIVGYVNTDLSRGVKVPTVAMDSENSSQTRNSAKDEDLGVLKGSVNGFHGGGGGGGAGGGRDGGAVALLPGGPPQTTGIGGSLAWNDSSVNGLRAQTQPGAVQSAPAGGQFQETTVAGKVDPSTLVKNGRMLYELGKNDEAESMLKEAVKLDPDNNTASYYLNVIQQDKIHRDMIQHNTDTQERMERVEKHWILPSANLGSANYRGKKNADELKVGTPMVGSPPVAAATPPSLSAPLAYEFNAGSATASNLGGSDVTFAVGNREAEVDRLDKKAPAAAVSPNGEEIIQPGLIDFEGAELSQVLDIYAKLVNRTLLRGPLPQAQIVFKQQTPMTKSEAIEALRSVLALNGVSLGNVGDRFVKAVPIDQKVATADASDMQKVQDAPLRKPAPDTPVPQPEILTSSNAFSTFSLNVSDVSFKLAEASLENGKLPDTASIRSEEFINAFDYRDPEAGPGQPMAFTSERARYPFAPNRELLRFAVKTAAAGRQAGRALNLVLLLDNSGSMERADRVAIVREALRVLAMQLQPQDTVSVVTFARTARLWADGVRGDRAGETLDRVGGITPEGGTNLEEAMRLAYETAHRHYLAGGMNRVVLLTDGAANLGNVSPGVLKEKVDAQRRQGIALDCFGIGWEDYNDDLLELLSSNGGGRYAFLNSPEEAGKDFAAKLAGALQIAAADVKVQVEFNPQRVISYRQIGYAKHQLTKEQFRDNTVAAGEIAAQEAGNALYTIEANPNGDGPVATVHVRYRIPGTDDYREHSWDVAYMGTAPALARSSPAMRLAATAGAFSEWLAASPYAQEVTLDELLKQLSGVPEVYGADDRPKQLETMIREAKSLEGK